MLFPIIGALIVTLQSCDTHCINGKGNTVIQNRTPGSFSGISFSSEGTVYVSQDPVTSFTAEAQQNILDDLVTKVLGDELKIYNDHCLRDHIPVVIHVSSPDINSLSLSGVGEMITTTKILSGHVDISVSGTGDFYSQDSIIASAMSEDLSGTGSINLLAACTSMHSTNSGTGTITLNGFANSYTIHSSGSGDMHAFGFITDTATISISGSCDVEISVDDVLDVTISGSGNVYYKGNPVVTTQISGSGSVIHVD